MRLAERRHESFRWLRLRNRLRPQRRIFTEPPTRPIGVKLELTYACNLRCAFCYTDSPRRTLQRSTDLSEDAWRRIVAEAIELGIVEAVVTGGEPLLRRELTLELIETMSREGIGIAFNTNGWFVDEEVVERLRPLPSVTVHLSIDGAAPHLHDAQRGVPGSWRRAVEGLDRLIGAGVNVCIVHVITPQNAAYFPQMLEQMWTLGVPWMRPTPVVLSGAAARGGDWTVSRDDLIRVVREFEARRGTSMNVDLRPGVPGDIAFQGTRAPGSMLIRPNGAVRTDSLRPFSYGNAAGDGLAACWEQIRLRWRDQRIQDWAESIKDSDSYGSNDLVAYLDDEVAVAGEQGEGNGGGRMAPVPAPAPLAQTDPAADLEQASERVRELALARRYRLNPLRAGGGEGYGERIVRRVADGKYLRLNGSAALVMEALDGGTAAEAAARLQAAGAPDTRAEDDALRAARDLVSSGIAAPARSTHDLPPQSPGASDLPGMEPSGDDV
jgi:MoaA/NifB/PqqE/SkfB family radical SAM enzyme